MSVAGADGGGDAGSGTPAALAGDVCTPFSLPWPHSDPMLTLT